MQRTQRAFLLYEVTFMQLGNLNRIVGGLNISDGNCELLFVEKILSPRNKAKKHLVDLIDMLG